MMKAPHGSSPLFSNGISRFLAMFTRGIFFTLLIFLTNADKEKLQVPRPHKPLDPVVYPDDYCMEWDDKSEFDYIVIGAGPAGATVGRRLAEDPSIRVLILEAGGNPPPESDIPTNIINDPSAVWNVTTVPKSTQCQGYIGNVCHYDFVKYLGGCSITNKMVYVRGNKEDFEEWERGGCPGWGFKNMLPYFLKLENFQDPQHKFSVDFGYHSSGGPFTTSPSRNDPMTYKFQITYNQALKNMRIPKNNDPNGKVQTGFGEVPAFLETTGYRGNVAKAYLLNAPENLKICKFSTVQKLYVKPVLNKYNVSGVEFLYNGTGKSITRVAQAKLEYILSAGPISSPQILERSGIGRKEVLENAGVKQILELSGVGENLQEQFLNFGCAFSLVLNNSVAPDPLSLSHFVNLLFLNLSDPSSVVPDTQWAFNPMMDLGLSKIVKPSIVKQYVKSSKPNRYVISTGSIILRQSNPGYVHIASTDPNSCPLYQPNQYTTVEETVLLGNGCRLVRKAMSDSILAPFDPQPLVLDECKKFTFNSDDEIQCGATLMGFPLHHLAGGTKMGPPSDPMAVVDPRLRVYKMKNLRIVDLGIMPKVSRGNTEVPTLAVSEKAADIIKEDRKKVKI